MSAILSRMNGDATFLALLYAVPPFLGLTAWLFFRRIAAGRQGSAALLIGNLLLLLLLLSTAFAGIEAWYRWGYDTTSAWNRARISKRWFERHWHENANGYRDSIDYDVCEIQPGDLPWGGGSSRTTRSRGFRVSGASPEWADSWSLRAE